MVGGHSRSEAAIHRWGAVNKVTREQTRKTGFALKPEMETS
jgi:hypothetical protein